MDVIIQLGTITQQINRYGALFLLVFGFIGNLLNCLVFTRPTIRTNPCAVYFLAATLVNFIVLIVAFTPAIIDGYNPAVNLMATVSSLCKINVFLLFSSRTTVLWMIAFATIDRYLISSPSIHRRQMSNLKNTYRCIAFICIISIIIWCEIFICFDANIIDSPIKCFPKSKECNIYNNFAQVVITMMPIAIMLIFGFSTIRNIHQTRQVIAVSTTTTTTTHTAPRNRRNENSLTKMLLIQVLIITLLGLPFGIITLYMSVTSGQEKSLIQIVTEGFLFSTLYVIAFIPNCISFFLFTLSGSLFREILIDIGKKLRQYF